VRTTGDGPEKAGHHGADEEATRVFTRLSTFEPDARDLRDDADHPGDDHARTFRRISGGAEAAAPPEPAPYAHVYAGHPFLTRPRRAP